MMLGKLGTGKGVATKTLVCALAAPGAPLHLSDRAPDYRHLMRALGVAPYEVSSNQKYLDPLGPVPAEHDEGESSHA